MFTPRRCKQLWPDTRSARCPCPRDDALPSRTRPWTPPRLQVRTAPPASRPRLPGCSPALMSEPSFPLGPVEEIRRRWRSGMFVHEPRSFLSLRGGRSGALTKQALAFYRTSVKEFNSFTKMPFMVFSQERNLKSMLPGILNFSDLRILKLFIFLMTIYYIVTRP